MTNTDTQERINAAIELIKEGYTYSNAANTVGISLSTVYNHCRAQGITSQKAYVKGRPFKVLRELQKDIPISKIALALGLSTQRIYQILRDAHEAGLPVHPRHARHLPKND